MKALQAVLAVASLSLLVSGCAAGTARPNSSATNLPPPPTAFNPRGLEAVLNKRDDELVALFGAPRLDVIEGQARKMQFANESCALDIFLYPPQNNARADRRSNYVEARDRSGNVVDSASCIAALR